MNGAVAGIEMPRAFLILVVHGALLPGWIKVDACAVLVESSACVKALCGSIHSQDWEEELALKY